MAGDLITYEELRRKFYYDPETGDFLRFGRKKNVGFISKGYLVISIGPCSSRKKYPAHRLAWFYVHGRWPKSELDHINNDRLDNRIANLREADRQQNGANRLTGREIRGIGWEKARKKWHAQIKINRRTYNLGRFKTKIEAAAAYDKAARIAFAEFAKLNGGD